MSIELKHLRYAEVAERCGSFRKAADLLALKQSNLSRRVRHLEEQLGVELFERTNGGVRPTAAGRDFVNGVRRVLNDLQWGTLRAGFYAFVSPIVALGTGAWFFGEAIGWVEIAGGALMLAAAAMALLRPLEEHSR